MQNRLNLSIKDYEIYTQIEIEIFPEEEKYGDFINFDYYRNYYHIYFNDNEKEIKNRYIIGKKDKVTKIKIRIDYQVKSFEKLFFNCICIKSINFKKFYRDNINNMSGMFSVCSSLEEIYLTNFNTKNVTNMSDMFYGCSSLEEISLTNFNTKNVTNMNGMFSGCSS